MYVADPSTPVRELLGDGVDLSNFMVLMYDGTCPSRSYLVSLDEYYQAFPDNEITLHPLEKVWRFHTAAGVETYTIGEGQRVPEGDHLWGPAFVFDLTGDVAQVQRSREFADEIMHGTVTR